MSTTSENLTPLKRALLTLDKMQKKLDEYEQRNNEPIAIIGLGCRAPGGVHDPESFWQLLRDGVDAITEVPRTRWKLEDYFDANKDAPGKMYTRSGGFLAEIDKFDALFFGITPREAASMDPQQRLVLETSWEALEHAGQIKEQLSGSRTGVFMGVCFNEYAQKHLYSGDATLIDGYCFTGIAQSVLTGRLSYCLGLQGPSVAVDTACSSSLVTVHLACQSLRSRESDMALAGGVNLMLTPENTIYFCKVGAMSPEGRCKTFDASADGYVRGEGCGVVVLKRLADALKDGDNILALIRGSAVNQDGRSNGLTAPNGPSQERVMRDALAHAGVLPRQVSYVEAHGTGTPLGDPIEVRALGNVYSAGRDANAPLLIGSVKTNFGHLEGAAGVMGLIKTVLALQHEQIPPHLHFKQLNPLISLAEIPARIPTQLLNWNAEAGKRFAGVSSFGISGTNAHVIVSDQLSVISDQTSVNSNQLLVKTDHSSLITDHCSLLPLSAHTPEALQALARSYLDFLPSALCPLPSVCFTASARRSHHEHRLALVGKSKAELIAPLEAFLKGEKRAGRKETDEPRKLALVFSGQGPQWFAMGRQLLQESPVFRQKIEECDALLRAHASWSLLEELQREEAASRLDQTEIAQPAIFALQVALAEVWRAWGLVPEAVVGHSVGEVAAAHVAGALSLAEAVRVIVHRGRLMQRATGLGKMAAVELAHDEALALLAKYDGRLSLAAINSAKAAVFSGEAAALEDVLRRLQEREVYCRMLPVNYAFHSAQMTPFSAALEQALHGLAPQAAVLPMYSTVTGKKLEGLACDAAYWGKNIRAAVRFADAINALVDEGHTLFVELSPHPVLSAYIAESLQLRQTEGCALPALRRGRNEMATMLEALGELYAHGYPIDWMRLYPHGGKVVRLPNYPWQRERYWVEDSGSRIVDRRSWIVDRSTQSTTHNPQSTTHHPLLGAHFQTHEHAHYWQTELSLAQYPYLADHRVNGAVVFPAAAYVEIALAAATEAFGEGAHALTKLAFHEALFLPEEQTRTAQIALALETPSTASFKLLSWKTDEQQKVWTLHASGVMEVQQEAALNASQTTETPEQIRARTVAATAANHVHAMARRGLQYGPCFQGLAELWQQERETLARVQLHESVNAEAQRYRIHPALLDLCFQTLLTSIASSRDTYLPVALGRVRWFDRPQAGRGLWAHTIITSGGNTREANLIGDIFLRDDAGNLLLEARGLELRRLPRDLEAAISDWFYEIAWQPRPLVQLVAESSEKKSRWLIFADHGGASARLINKLEERGDKVVVVHAAAAFKKIAARHYEISPTHAEEYKHLLAEILNEDAVDMAGIAHLWSLEASASPANARDLIASAHELGCLSVMYLAQALGAIEMKNSPRLWLITSGVHPHAGSNSSVEMSLDHSPLEGGLDHSPLEGGQGGVIAASRNLAQIADASPSLYETRHQKISNTPRTPLKGGLDNSPLKGGQGGVNRHQTTFATGLAQSPLWGLGAVIANEHPAFHCTRLDLSAVPQEAEINALCAELRANEDEDQIALRADQRYAARLTHTSLAPEESLNALAKEKARAQAGQNYALEIDQPGVLDHLTLRATSRRAPGRGEIEIQVKAAGLNFLDVMKAMGVYPGLDPNAAIALGGECAGVVTAVGAGVEEFKRGDEVVAITPSFNHVSLFRAFVTVPAVLVGRKPEALSFAEAATIPAAFLTAHYALNHLGRMSAGERVLIHSASGGVGLAALQLAQQAGCEIFATAGNEEKRAFLQSLGVAHVFDSRSLEFAREIVKSSWIVDGGSKIVDHEPPSTNHNPQSDTTGVDLVLNSLTGEAILKSLEVLRPMGRFLEIGKRDIYQNTRIGLAPFKNNLSYFAIDLAAVIAARPQLVGAMLRTLLNLYEQGALKPLPRKSFAISEAAAAFRAMAQGKHIGKLVLAFEEEQVRLAPTREQCARFHANATYLITGGMGGLGLQLARWMVEHGARHLVLVGRKAPAEEAQAAIHALEQKGARVLTAQADVSVEAQVLKLLADVRAQMPRLKGVVHAAGILDDGILQHMSAERLAHALRPKAEGARLLHEHTQHEALDYFVLFSSVAAILGTTGQGNYAAGNAFMDSLAQHRRASGLPALSINWGPWSQVGLAATQANRGVRLESLGLAGISPEEGLAAFARVLYSPHAQAVIMPFDYAQWQQFHPAAREASLFKQMKPDFRATDSSESQNSRAQVRLRPQSFREQLLLAEAGRKRRALLETHLQEQIANVLKLRPALVTFNKPFRSLGLDSLLALELRNRLEASLGLTLPATTFFNYPNIAALAPHLAAKMEVPLEAEEVKSDLRTTVLKSPQNSEAQVRLRADTDLTSSQNSEAQVQLRSDDDEDIDKILAEIEQLSEEEARKILVK